MLPETAGGVSVGCKRHNGLTPLWCAAADAVSLQIGNAVAPPMAAALGRCLLLAAAKKAPVAEPVIYVSAAGS